MRPTLFQLRQQREREARAANVSRLLASAQSVLDQADAEQRDLRPDEAQRCRLLLDRVDRLQAKG